MDMNMRRLMGGGDDSELIILILMICFLIGTVAMSITSRYAKGVPYTVLLLLIGIFTAVIDHYCEDSSLKTSLNQLIRIPPKLIIYIFIPSLLFGEAMRINYYQVKGILFSALLLVGPGCLLGTYAMASLVYVCLPYGWSWNLCCAVGAILCATDPVSVINVMRRANISPGLTCLITGESLVNDAAALVLFNLYTTALSGDASALYPQNIAAYFSKVIFISPMIGIACGAFAVVALRLSNRRKKEEDTIIQVGTTIGICHLSFFIGELTAKVSGVVAVVVAGFTISVFGTPLIMEPVTMRTVWEAFDWICNTILFFLAGLIIGRSCLLYNQFLDYVYVFVGYLLLMLVRCALITGFFPFLYIGKDKVNLREALFLGFSGLRGGVAIALALSLQNNSFLDEETADRAAFIVCGIANFTIIINAVLALPLLKYLRLVSETTAETILMHGYAERLLEKKSLEVLQTLHSKTQVKLNLKAICGGIYYLKDLRGREVRDWLLKTQLAKKYDRQVSTKITTPAYFQSQSLIKIHNLDASSIASQTRIVSKVPSTIVNLLLIQRIRITFIEMLKTIYNKKINFGVLPRESRISGVVLHSTDVAMDRIDEKLADWGEITKFIDNHEIGMERCLSYLFKREEDLVLLLHIFIDGHTEAQSKLIAYIEGKTEAAMEEVKRVINESNESIAAARAALDAMAISDSIMQSIHTKQAIRVILRAEEQLIEDLEAEGILTDKEAQTFYKKIRKNFRKIEKSSKVDSNFELDDNDNDVDESSHNDHRGGFGRRVSHMFGVGPSTIIGRILSLEPDHTQHLPGHKQVSASALLDGQNVSATSAIDLETGREDSGRQDSFASMDDIETRADSGMTSTSNLVVGFKKEPSEDDIINLTRR